MKTIALIFVFAVAVQAGRPILTAVHPLHLKSGERIVNGDVATRGQFPHQAFILVDGANYCGGSLLSPEWVLTAGHCVHNAASWDVTVGMQVRSDVEEGRITERTSEAVLHESYNSQVLVNDIALLKINNAFPIDDVYVRAVRLPAWSDVSNSFVGTAVTVSGWGKDSTDATTATDELNFVNLNTISNDDCIKKYGYIVTDSTLCCAAPAGRSTCNGDSGGPLILDDGSAKQIGIVSFVSSAGCASGSPSGYVRLTRYLRWIADNTGIVIED